MLKCILLEYRFIDASLVAVSTSQLPHLYGVPLCCSGQPFCGHTMNQIRELIQLKITIYTYYYVLIYVYCCQICDHSLRNQFLHLEIYKKERKKKTLSYCFQCFLCSFQLVGSQTNLQQTSHSF